MIEPTIPNDPEIPELDDLVRRNPVYRDTPLGQGEVELISRRPQRPTRIRRSRRLPWKWLGLPEPRAVVRALLIDGYPRELRRWAYERMEEGILWLAFASGMIAAALVAWFGVKLDWPAAGVMLLVLGAAVLPGLLALSRLIPIYSALRYASRWRKQTKTNNKV